MDEGEQGNDRGANARSQRLCHHSDLAAKLPEDVRRDQFILWRDQLDELLNHSAGLRGVDRVLERIRMWKNTAVEEEVIEGRVEGGLLS